MSLFFHLMDMCLVNVLAMRRSKSDGPEDEDVEQKKVREELIDQIVEFTGGYLKDGKLQPQPPPPAASSIKHYPDKTSDRKRCVQCSKEKKQSKVSTLCVGCQKYMHLGACWKKIHDSL